MENNQNQNQNQQPQAPQYQAPQYQTPQYPQPQNKANSAATASLICGIVSVIFAIMGGFIGIVAGIIGLVGAINAKKKGVTGGMLTAGLVLSIIGLALSAVTFFACTLPATCATIAMIPYM